MSDDETTSRTTMLWPPDLKEAVREKVGPRGLTDFTIAAVRSKLIGHDASQEELLQLRHDVKHLREYAQRAADSLACAGEVESRQERLMEIGVPAWINTIGWPDWAVALKVDSAVDTPMTKEAPQLEESAGQEPVSEAPTADTPADTPADTGGTHFEHPAHDADVDEWREYARSMGYQGPDVDKANRSQIRTMIGIPQPVKKVKMRHCDGCGEDYDVFTDGEFEKHMAHKHAVASEVEKAAEIEEAEQEVKTIDEKGEPISVRVLEKQAAERAAQDLPHDVQTRPKNDLFEKLQREGKELGYDLKPASEVLRPEGQERSYEDDIPSEVPSDLGLPEETPSPVEPDEVRPTLRLCPNHPGNELPCPECCPNCGSELVGGECWECM